MSERLSAKSAMPADVAMPRYSPHAHGIGIVHLGIGAFHRAHQAVYIDEAIARHGGDWRILGVSLRSAAVRDQIAPQDGRYILVERSGQGDRLRQIGAVADVLVAPEDPKAVITAIARPSVSIVSLTVTEKGYCHDPATGTLDEAHPDVVHDLARPDAPRSAIGLLAAGLAARHASGTSAPTLLCCDNLPANGVVLQRVLTRFAALRSPALADWIERWVAFPSTMVDRIVPAVTEADIEQLAGQIGALDRAMVKTEMFSQWAIEDRFAGPRPWLESVGVQIVPDVRPFELAKLRMLNGSHSTLAYVGLLLGHVFVHEAIGDPALQSLVERLMRDEAALTLPPAPGFDAGGYAGALCLRFANPALEHRLIQIAMDGSQKLPQRLLGTIADRLAAGATADVALLGVAAWMLHARGWTHKVDDPMAARLADVAAAAGDDARKLVAGMLAIESIFGRMAHEAKIARRLMTHVEALIADPHAHIAAMAS